MPAKTALQKYKPGLGYTVRKFQATSPGYSSLTRTLKVSAMPKDPTYFPLQQTLLLCPPHMLCLFLLVRPCLPWYVPMASQREGNLSPPTMLQAARSPDLCEPREEGKSTLEPKGFRRLIGSAVLGSRRELWYERGMRTSSTFCMSANSSPVTIL